MCEAFSMEKKTNASTTIQVRKEVRNRLEMLKVLGDFEDLNAVVARLADHYAQSNQIRVDEKMDAFIKKLQK